MQIGVIYPQIELRGDPEAVRRISLATEELGYDHLLVYDHVLGATHDREPKLWGPYTEKHPFHDPFVMLTYVAALTKRINLFTGILILPQRQTALVARQAADVSLFSGGRLNLGVGLGWSYVEYDALGQDFSKRGKRMDEQVELLRALWTGEVVDFKGTFDRIDRCALNPPPASKIPLWMGGFADPALRRAAAVADGFIFSDGAGSVFEQLEKLNGFLKEQGRAGEKFGLCNNMLRARDPAQIVDMIKRWEDAGGTHVSVHTMAMGFTKVEEHIDYITRVRDAVRR